MGETISEGHTISREIEEWDRIAFLKRMKEEDDCLAILRQILQAVRRIEIMLGDP